MNDRSGLTELARFVARSPLASRDPGARQRAFNAVAAGVRPRPQRQGVGDLLGIVLVLSARTRRLVLPPVEIGLDVFAPGGRRAVRMFLPKPGGTASPG